MDNRELQKLITDYKGGNEKYNCNHLEEHLNYFRKLPLEEAIEKAVLSKGEDGGKFRHQQRLNNEDLENAKNKLLNKINQLENFRTKTFEELYNFIVNHNFEGIGAVTNYDIALRIGANLKIEPEYIYLQGGVIEGAKNLNLDIKGKKYLTKEELSELITKNFKPYEIEDFLCVYKDRFKS